MRITKLVVSHFKGRDRAIELGPINVVHGRNWSGKTAVLAAIRVGLLGYEPRLGKRNSDTFSLATGSTMAVELNFSDGSQTGRKWTMEKGSVRAEQSYAGDGKPEDLKVPSMLLDVRDYFALSAQKRRDYVLSLLDLKAAGLTDAKLTAELKQVIVDPHGEVAELEIGEVVEEFDYWCADRDQHETPLSQWMAENVERLKERLKGHGDVIMQCAGVLQTIAQERATHPEPTPEDQTEAEAALQLKLEALTAEFGAKTAAVGRWTQKLALLEQLGKAPDLSSEVERLTQERNAAKAKADAAPKARDRAPELAALRKARDTASGAHSMAKSSLENLRSKYEKQIAFDSCPTCGSQEHVSAMKEKLAGDYLEAKALLDATVQEAQKKLADADADLERLTKETEAEAGTWKESASLINKVGLAETVLRQVEQKQQKRLHILSELKGYEDLVDPSTGAAQEDPLKRSMDGYTASVEVVTAQMGTVRADIVKCRGLQKQRTIALERDAQYADAEKRKGESETKQAVAKACLKVLQGAQQAAIDGAFGPFLKTVRKFTDGVLDFTLEYREGDIGYVQNGTWISHTTFSGAETALTYAGLGVALAAKSPVKLVMLDEVLLTTETKSKVARRMAKLIKDGVIDQFVIVDVDSAGWTGDGVTFIKAE